MKKTGRSESKDISLDELLIKTGFKEEIDENNLLYAASLTYFFGVLYAFLTEAVDRTLGLVLILTAVMIIWGVGDKRKQIRRKYEEQIKSLKQQEA